MNVNKIKLKIKELESNLENKTVQVVLQNKTFELDKLKKSLKDYDKYIEQVSDEDLIKTIETKINELVSYSNQSSFENYSHKFINAANFLISNTPKEQKNQENNTAEIIQISEEEFSKRYDKLLEALNFEDEECNLILETPSKEKKPFKVFKNKNKSLAIYAKSSEKPMTIASDRLLEVAFHRKEPTYKSYEPVIISKIIDNSIFDFFQNNSLPKDLFEAMKAKLSKNEDELIVIRSKLEKIQEENQTIEEKKEQFNEIFEKSESLDSKIKAAEDKAKLNASVSYWQLKQITHRHKFIGFGILAIVLIGLLLLILFNVLNGHENQINESKKIEIINKINTTTETKKIIEDSNKSISAIKQTLQEPKKIISNNEENSKSFDFDYSKLAWYILMIFASSSAFWIIRITVKIALSNLHLSEDAHERVVMIQTYLSFVKEGQVEENDKNLILSSLFRPSNIGIIKDESSVTVADIITAFKK